MKRLFIFLLVWLVSACGSTVQPIVQSSSETTVPGATAPEGSVASVVTGNNNFAFDVYRALSSREDQKGKNLFLSPFSISSALAMTYAGARSETEAQMARVMHFELKQSRLHPAFSALLARMQGKEGYQLSIANALWPQKEYPFRDDFMRTGTVSYQGGIQALDYQTNTEGSRQIINQWVEQKTQDKIKELIPPGALNQLTRLVLTNAIYFKGKWDKQLNTANTAPVVFWLNGTETVMVPMMSQTERVSYFQNDTLQMLELPYAGKELSMVVLLPERNLRIGNLELMLSATTVERWMSSMTQQEVRVNLPRFKTTCSYDLSSELIKMGMTDAFNPSKADFSAMTAKDSLYISQVLHKTFVEVNEEGTEAAAATAVVVRVRGTTPLGYQFRADRPFIYLIRDRTTGCILFLGRVMNPLLTGE
jgi:serpin B